MQKEGSTVDNNGPQTDSTDSPSPFQTRKPHLSPQPATDHFASFYHPSPMFPPAASTTSLSLSPSDCSSSYNNNNNDVVSTVDDRLRQASFVLEYQQLYNRYAMCLAHLQDSLLEVDSLRDDNDALRVANSDLVNRLSLLSQATIQNCLLTSAPQPPLSFINDFNRMSIGGNAGMIRENREEICDISPTSVIEHSRFDRRNTPERVQLPKSISVRSSGYLKIAQRGGDPSRDNRVKSPSLNESQRVYVPGGKREEEALEFDVYNQGMFKTELCNKWQETGKCPYGDNCQFAHGITELRPVIRHPRYKTEVCRMVLAGDTCPYGHRCHFRHSLTEQERLLGPLGRFNELNR
ncbi:hypothetical protein RHSIM_Rhsim08G0084000 [Rhododendron simsii]|uniref:C3H1-type domain-containing protein n=1 Tax=Rhododendron simsii TaxID=118357 RepID=A0A834LHW8_RHOSS|nr:hypothetical protein RHSIM_Rhsim08G0084000 [Rhododendron simsii]